MVFHSVLCLYILTKIKNNYRGRSRKEGIKANYSFCTAITLSLINCLFVGGPLILGFFTLNKDPGWLNQGGIQSWRADCKVIWGFSTSLRVGIPNPVLIKGQLYYKVLFSCMMEAVFFC